MLHIRVMIFDQIKAGIVHTLTILRILHIYIKRSTLKLYHDRNLLV